MSLALLAPAVLLLLLGLALCLACYLPAIPCTTCGRQTHAAAERLLCQAPLVLEVTYRCADCGGTIVRYLVAEVDG